MPISSEVDAEATKQNDLQQDQNHYEENESKKLAKKYFEYFGGQADEREQAIENGLYEPVSSLQSEARISIQTATLQFIDEIEGLGGGFSALSCSER